MLGRAEFETLLVDVDAVVKEKSAARDAVNSEAAPAGGGGGGAAAAAKKFRPEARDLQRMRTLGTGTFGRVTLVQHKPSGGVYALKAMQKQQIMQSKQERNIMNEKNLLYVCAHPFVLALIECYQDTDSIYMLMEIVQGGELWCYIYERFDVTRPFRDAALGGFTGPAAAFYAGCVIAAFAHVHAQGIAYRDLKPENLLIDVKGYCKVIDFGFAKKIPGPKGDLSYTICGTPEYLAPEILNSKGHDKAVDVWALGCLVYELLVGRTPFADDNQSRIFQRVLGADKFLATPAVWPRGFDPDAKDLIKQMLATSPARRLGYGTKGPLAIKDHAWFKKLADDKAGGFDWEKLVTKTLPAPFVPGIKDPLDTSHFDPYDEDDSVPRFTGLQETYKEWSAEFVTFPPPVRS